MNNHAITNNRSKENGICIKSLLILKEVNRVVLHSIVKIIGSYWKSLLSFIDGKKLRLQAQELKTVSHLEDVWESVEQFL